MVTTITCHNCKRSGLYGVGSLEQEYVMDNKKMYFVECRFCGHQTGTDEELASLIELAADYEPNEDEIYERAVIL